MMGGLLVRKAWRGTARSFYTVSILSKSRPSERATVWLQRCWPGSPAQSSLSFCGVYIPVGGDHRLHSSGWHDYAVRQPHPRRQNQRRFSSAERLYRPQTTPWLELANLKTYPDRYLILQPVWSLSEALQDHNLIQGKPVWARAGLRYGGRDTKELGWTFSRCPPRPVYPVYARIAVVARPTPAVGIIDTCLVVQNKAGEKIWTYRFDFPVNQQAYDAPDNEISSWTIWRRWQNGDADRHLRISRYGA